LERCPATRSSSTGRVRASTRRSTCWPRTASRASRASCSSASSLRSPGTAWQLGWQALAAVSAPVYAFGATFLLLKLIALFTPLRVTEREEAQGLDITQHGEEAYASGEGAILISAPDGGVDGRLVTNPA
jgi:hypothetical protein